MLELVAYLRANGFKTFIVSGGGIDFMRPWTERVYGIPPERAVIARHGHNLNRRHEGDCEKRDTLNSMAGFQMRVDLFQR
jgi:phosphoserine phosphatase